MPRFLAALAALLALAGPAAAQEPAWPARPITIMGGFPAGAGTDIYARKLAEPLSQALGVPVVVDARTGAGGNIASDLVAKARPDGYTFLLATAGTHAINPALYDKLAYDVQKDLQPVGLAVRNVEVLVVPANAPYNTGAEFIAAARKSGQPLTLASSGTGSVPHLAMELLSDASKTDLLHVPYKGAAPAITDVIAGHVNGFFGDIPGLLPFIKTGKLKPIGIAASRRNPLLPEVKTFTEMGIPGVDSDNWYAVFAGRAVPAADIEKVSAALRKALGDETVRSRLAASGAEPAPSTAAELAALLKQDTDKWTRVVRAKKIKPD